MEPVERESVNTVERHAQDLWLVSSIFGGTERGCDCDPTRNCVHEPFTDRGLPNPIYRGGA